MMGLLLVFSSGLIFIICAAAFVGFYIRMLKKTAHWEDPTVTRLKSELRQSCLLEIGKEEAKTFGTRVLPEQSFRISWSSNQTEIRFQCFGEDFQVDPHEYGLVLTIVMADRSVTHQKFTAGESILTVDPNKVSAIFVRQDVPEILSEGGRS